MNFLLRFKYRHSSFNTVLLQHGFSFEIQNKPKETKTNSKKFADKLSQHKHFSYKFDEKKLRLFQIGF